MTIVRVMHIVISAFLAGAGPSSFALDYGASLEAGILQQPTSQYFHAGYGVSFWATAKNEKFGLRGMIFERPEFRSNGFEDQDSGGALLVYGSAWNKARMHLLAGVGAGRFVGFVRPQDQHEGLATRRYSIPGVVVWTQFIRSFGAFQMGVSHWALAGYAGREQFDALVVWPYSVFCLSLGWSV